MKRLENFLLGFFILLIFLQSCTNAKKVYQSDCNNDESFKRVGFSHLMDSLDYYDKKYVEVSGIYLTGKEQSALYSDSLFVDHSNSNGLWVSFSQDCPLYLSGTKVGLFEYNNGKFIGLNNKAVIIRGVINVHNRGHLNEYKGSIERVSYMRL